MKVKISKKPAVEKKIESEAGPIIPFETLPPCTWPANMVAYGPVGEKLMLITDPVSWAYRPRDGWVALYTTFGRNFFECMKNVKEIEVIRSGKT